MNHFSILNGAKHFSPRIFQNYLVFLPAKKYVKYFSGNTRIDLWKFNRILEENIENITKSDKNFAVIFVDHNVLPYVGLNGPCLINNNVYVPKKVIHVYMILTY